MLICRGLGYEEIAETQNLSIWTAKSPVQYLHGKGALLVAHAY